MTMLDAVDEVQRTMRFSEQYSKEYFEGMLDGLFPGCSHGLEVNHVSGDGDYDPPRELVVGASVNLVTERGQLYDLVWTKGSDDVRLTRWTHGDQVDGSDLEGVE